MRVFQIRCFINKHGVRYRAYERETKYKTRLFGPDKQTEVWTVPYLWGVSETEEGKSYDSNTGFPSFEILRKALKTHYGAHSYIIEEWEPAYGD